MFADDIKADSSDEALALTCFPRASDLRKEALSGECDKQRVVCAVLSERHYNLGVVFGSEVQAIFDVGADWDRARALILNYLREIKKSPKPKVFWDPPVTTVQSPTPSSSTPLLNVVRATFTTAAAAVTPHRAITEGGFVTPTVISSSSVGTAATSVTLVSSVASTASTTSSTLAASSMTTSSSACTATTSAACSPPSATLSKKGLTVPKAFKARSEKRTSSSLFSRSERWDLERVNLLLEQLSSCSPPHRDVRVLSFVKKHADKEGFLRVEYRPAQTSPLGRVFSGVGFQVCTKETRSYCSARFYVEDDLVNAFPTIMRQVFHEAGLNTPFLDEYVDQREKIFKVLGEESSLDRSCIKKLFIISLHGGNYRSVTRTHLPFLQKFQEELRSRTTSLLQDPRFADIKALAGTSKNVLGRAVSLISQQNERKIMQAKTTFTERFLRVGSDCLMDI